MLAKFLGLNLKGLYYLSLEKEKDNFLCCAHLLHNGRVKLDKFQVAVLQRQQRNVQK